VGFALAFGYACSARETLFTPAPPGVTRLELKGNVIRYGDKILRFGDRIEKWVEVLGLPSKIENQNHFWFGGSVEAGVWRTDDGRGYVSSLFVNLGENGYADGFVLQGVVLNKGGPPLLDVMDALSGSETELWGRWVRGRYEAAEMRVTSPDGFVVGAYGDLMCVPPPPPSKGKCTKVIDKLSIEAEWHW
jgi:hypothetical protein